VEKGRPSPLLVAVESFRDSFETSVSIVFHQMALQVARFETLLALIVSICSGYLRDALSYVPSRYLSGRSCSWIYSQLFELFVKM